MIVYIKTLENIAARGGSAGIMTIQCVGHQLSEHHAYELGTIDVITAVITTLQSVWPDSVFRLAGN